VSSSECQIMVTLDEIPSTRAHTRLIGFNHLGNDIRRSRLKFALSPGTDFSAEQLLTPRSSVEPCVGVR
jgi:hypothetical protein